MNFLKKLFGKGEPQSPVHQDEPLPSEVEPPKQTVEPSSVVSSDKHQSDMDQATDLVELILSGSNKDRQQAEKDLMQRPDYASVLPYLFSKLEDESTQGRAMYLVQSIVRKTKDEYAIEPLMQYYTVHHDWSDLISNTLSSIPTESATLALLEMFRLTESKYDKEGITQALLTSEHFQRVKEQASSEEFETILLEASRGTDCSNEKVINALAEVGTTSTLNRLLFFLRHAREHHSSWRMAQKALINLGKPALPMLIEFLEEKVSTDRKAQTLGRKRVLEILTEVGDETCVPAIRSIEANDNTIQEESRAALQAIEKRVGTLPEVDELKVETPRSILASPIGDPYVDRCLTLAFSEIDDGREWNEYQELLQLPRLSNNPSKYEEFLVLANSFKEKYEDFDHLYFWIAVAHRRQKHYDIARQELQGGLQVCRRKYNLCSDLGLTEFEASNLTEAVRWWIQSLLLQEDHEEYGNHEPFLYLAYVSQSLGLSTLTQRFFSQSDRIELGQNRLVQAEAAKISNMVREQGDSSMRQTLELLGQSNLKFGS